MIVVVVGVPVLAQSRTKVIDVSLMLRKGPLVSVAVDLQSANLGVDVSELMPHATQLLLQLLLPRHEASCHQQPR